MSTKKNNTPQIKVETITSEAFEKMAVKAAEKVGIPLEGISTSFNRYKPFNDEFANDKVITTFNVYMSTGKIAYTGQSTHPSLAVREAVNKFLLDTGKAELTTETIIDHEQFTQNPEKN
jgi:hypothetical protein